MRRTARPDRVFAGSPMLSIKPGGSEPGATMNLTSPITLNVPLAVPEGPAEGPDVAQVPPPVGGSPPPKVPWPTDLNCRKVGRQRVVRPASIDRGNATRES